MDSPGQPDWDKIIFAKASRLLNQLCHQTTKILLSLSCLIRTLNERKYLEKLNLKIAKIPKKHCKFHALHSQDPIKSITPIKKFSASVHQNYISFNKSFNHKKWEKEAWKERVQETIVYRVKSHEKSSQTCWKWNFIFKYDKIWFFEKRSTFLNAMDAKKWEYTLYYVSILIRFVRIFYFQKKSYFLWLNQSFIDLIASHHTDRVEF